jgi:hypothetical protein
VPMESNRKGFSQEEIESTVRERINLLRGLPYEALLALPASAGETLSIAGRSVERWTYVERQSADQLRVVVQFAAEKVPGSSLGQSYAEGFRLWRNGTQSPITPPEIYEFW